MSHLTSRLLVETLVFQDGKCQITVTHLLAFSFTLRWKHLHSGAANINRWPWKEKKKKPLSLLTLTDRSACLLIAENTEAWLTNSQHNVLYSVWATTYCIMCMPNVFSTYSKHYITHSTAEASLSFTHKHKRTHRAVFAKPVVSRMLTSRCHQSTSQYHCQSGNDIHCHGNRSFSISTLI